MARAAQHTRRTIIRDDIETGNSDQVTSRVEPQYFLARIVWFVAGVLLTILALRFILAVLGANPGNGFVNFIYAISHPFVVPFFNMFHYNVVSNGISRVEIYTLVAMVVYTLIASGVTYLLTIAARDTY